MTDDHSLPSPARPSRVRLGAAAAALALALCLSACGNGGTPTSATSVPVRGTMGPPAPAPADFKTYENPAVGLTISYPKGWSVQEKVGSTLVGFVAPGGGTTRGTFVDNANISLEPVGDQTLADYNATARSQVSAVFPDASIESVSSTTLAGRPATAYTYTASEGTTPARLRQVFMIDGGTLYALTFAAALDRWDALAPAYGEMERSFRLTADGSPAPPA